jgi:hypothetical protein
VRVGVSLPTETRDSSGRRSLRGNRCVLVRVHCPGDGD